MTIFERVMLVENTSTGWKPIILPLYDTRILFLIISIFQRTFLEQYFRIELKSNVW
jgi:hypothetical protein